MTFMAHDSNAEAFYVVTGASCAVRDMDHIIQTANQRGIQVSAPQHDMFSHNH